MTSGSIFVICFLLGSIVSLLFALHKVLLDIKYLLKGR